MFDGTASQTGAGEVGSVESPGSGSGGRVVGGNVVDGVVVVVDEGRVVVVVDEGRVVVVVDGAASHAHDRNDAASSYRAAELAPWKLGR